MHGDTVNERPWCPTAEVTVQDSRVGERMVERRVTIEAGGDLLVAPGTGSDDLLTGPTLEPPLPGRPWTLAALVEARTRIARGLVVYRPREVADLLSAEAEVEVERVARATVAARGVGPDGFPSVVADECAVRAGIEELRAVAARIGTLAVGDVPGARTLADTLGSAAYAWRRRPPTAEAQARAAALSRGAQVVGWYLVPHCLTWETPMLTCTTYEREILTRVCAGAPDVRLATGDDAVAAPEAHSCLTPRELRRLVEVTDAATAFAHEWRRAPGRGTGPGVVLYTPDEVALLVEAEARLYSQAAELLLGTAAEAGDGARLRNLATGLAGVAWRVRRLERGDVAAANTLIEAIRHECQAATQRRAHGFWDPDPAHLQILATFVGEYLLPLRVDERDGVTSGILSERQVHQRWQAGAVDLREVARMESPSPP